MASEVSEQYEREAQKAIEGLRKQMESMTAEERAGAIKLIQWIKVNRNATYKHLCLNLIREFA